MLTKMLFSKFFFVLKTKNSKDKNLNVMLKKELIYNYYDLTFFFEYTNLRKIPVIVSRKLSNRKKFNKNKRKSRREQRNGKRETIAKLKSAER